jgi:ribosome-associated protein
VSALGNTDGDWECNSLLYLQALRTSMTQRRITDQLLGNELEFTTSRSSGPGGQNVNKVNSKVTLRFDIRNSLVLTDDEKAILSHKLKSRMTIDGVLLLSSQDKRSQLQNKEEVILKLEHLIAKAFEKKKPRKATKQSKAAKQDRNNKKKIHSEKKKWRQKPE